jgi:uncharacterized protein YukE
LGVETRKISTMGVTKNYDYSEKTELKKNCSTVTVKRIFYVIVVMLVIGSVIFSFVYPPLKFQEIEQKQHDANDETRKDVNNSLRLFINEHIIPAVNEIQQLKTENKSVSNSGQELRQSFQDMRDHLNVLILKVGNLSAVSTVNSSSDSEMSRLFLELNDTRNSLVRLQTKLTKLNSSVHNYIMPFVNKAVTDLSQELNILRISTAANITELWKRWRRTDAEMEDVVKLLAQQNETFHFKMAYHSDTLYSEEKDVERKQSKFHNDTRRMLNSLHGQLNETRRGILQSVDNRIAQANKTWHEALEDVVRSLHSSVAKIDAKVNKLQKRTYVLIDEVKDDLSKAKAKFQENDRKHDQAISGAATKMESVQNRVTKLEGERNSDIQTIAELKDERNSDMEKWNWNTQMIVIFVCLGINFLLTFIILFNVYCCK